MGEGLIGAAQRALANPRRIYGYAYYGEYADSPENPQQGDRFVKLDKVTHGLQYKKMIYLGGRPKSGKSMLLASFLPNIAEQCPDGQKIRVVTLEMTGEAYMKRMAAIMAQADQDAIDTGYADPTAVERYIQAVKYLQTLPIEYIEAAQMRELVQIIDNKDVPTFFWALDNFGLVAEGTDYKDLQSTANKIQHLCQKVATGMIIGHLNRASVGKRPTIESIGGTDQLGRNADEIWLLYKVLEGLDVDPADLEDGEPAELVLFMRDRKGGQVPLWWDRNYACFRDLNPDEQEEIVIPDKKRGKK